MIYLDFPASGGRSAYDSQRSRRDGNRFGGTVRLSFYGCVLCKVHIFVSRRREAMKHSHFVMGLVAVALCALPILGQEAAKKKPGPAPSPSQAVLEAWNDIGRKLIAMAGDFPEDKYSYKPNPDSRTFEENILHAAASMYYFTDIANGKKPHYADDPKDLKIANRAELVAFVKKCVEDGAATIKEKGDKGMQVAVVAGSPHLDRLYDLAYGLIEHSGEHYGQLVVYYRINGLVPPESRPKK